MNKRDHKSKPAPRTSPVMDSRSAVTAHNDTKSMGTHKSRRKIVGHRAETSDLANGREIDGGSAPPVATSRNNGRDLGGRGEAPGANGPPTTGPMGLGTW